MVNDRLKTTGANVLRLWWKRIGAAINDFGATPAAYAQPRIQITASTSTTVRNCSPTRQRIRRCEVFGLPPRNMLMRPISSTRTTPPIANGTALLRRAATNCSCAGAAAFDAARL